MIEYVQMLCYDMNYMTYIDNRILGVEDRFGLRCVVVIPVIDVI